MAEDPQDSRRLNLPTSVVAAYSRSQQGEGYQLAPLLRPDHRPQQLLHPPRRQSTSLDSPTVHPAVSKVTATALTPIQKLYEHAWFKTVNNVQAEVGRVHTELTSLIETERGRRVQAEVAMEELRKENAALKMECARLEREGGGEGAREERALRISLEQKLMDAMERLRSIAEGIYPNTANRPSSSYSEPATLVGSDSEPEYGLPLVKKRAGITGNSREHRVSVSSTNSPPNTLGPHVHHTRTPSPAYESKTVDSSALNVVSSTLTFNPPTSRVPTGDRGLDQWQAPHRHRSDTRTSPIHPISPDTERGDRTRLSLPSSARSSSSHSHPDNPTSSSPSSSTSNNPQTYPPPQRPGLVLPPLSDMYNYRLPPHGNLKFVNSGEGICESPVDIDSNSGSHSTKRPSSSASASASGSGSGSGARPRSASTIHQSSHRGSPSSRTQPPPPPPPPPQHQLQSTFRLPSRRNGDGGVEERCLLKKKRDRNEFESGGGEGSGSGSGEGIGGGGGENSECASGERKVKRKLSMSAPNGYSEGEVEIEKRDSVKEGEVEMEVWPRLRPVRDFEERTRNHDHGEDFRTGIGGRGRGSMSMQEVLPNPLPLPPAPSPVGNRDRVRDQLQGQSKEERSISPSGMALRAGVSSWSVTSPTTSACASTAAGTTTTTTKPTLTFSSATTASPPTPTSISISIPGPDRTPLKNTSTNVRVRNKLGINHMDLLYETRQDKMVCRMCRSEARDGSSSLSLTSSSAAVDGTSSTISSTNTSTTSTTTSSTNTNTNTSPTGTPTLNPTSSTSSSSSIVVPKKFPSKASWAELIGHCQEAHPKSCEELEKLSPSQVAELRQRMASSKSPGFMLK